MATTETGSGAFSPRRAAPVSVEVNQELDEVIDYIEAQEFEALHAQGNLDV